MQRPRRSIRPVTFYDDKLAQGEEVIKKSRLETSKKKAYEPITAGCSREALNRSKQPRNKKWWRPLL
jgi:hypothetical protein